MTEPVPWDQPLVLSARKWIAEALAGWVEADHAKVVTLSPIAVEHLAKAALWHCNPVLLAPLDNNHKKSFLALATSGELSDKSLRTIGLSDALDRVTTVFGTALPLPPERRRRLIETRGGALHFGQVSPDDAQHVLADVLTLFQWLAGRMSINPNVLFGVYSDTAARLLDEHRSEKQHSIDRRIAFAKSTFMQLAQSVGHDLLHDTIGQKEELTHAKVSQMIDRECVVSDYSCPACSQKGRLIGELETHPQAGIDRDGDPEAVRYTGDYDFFLIPDSFYCNVCRLALHDSEELSLSDLPHEKFKLGDDELSESLVAYAAAKELG